MENLIFNKNYFKMDSAQSHEQSFALNFITILGTLISFISAANLETITSIIAGLVAIVAGIFSIRFHILASREKKKRIAILDKYKRLNGDDVISNADDDDKND